MTTPRLGWPTQQRSRASKDAAAGAPEGRPRRRSSRHTSGKPVPSKGRK
jgi:hypothetical protein